MAVAYSTKLENNLAKKHESHLGAIFMLLLAIFNGFISFPHNGLLKSS